MLQNFQFSLNQSNHQGSSIEVELTRPDAGVKVLPEVNPSLPLHRVVQVSDLSAFLLVIVWRAPAAAASAATTARSR